MHRTLLDCLRHRFFFISLVGVALGDNHHTSGVKPVIYNGSPVSGTCTAERWKISFLGVHDDFWLRETQDAVWIENLEKKMIPGTSRPFVISSDPVYTCTLKVPKLVVEMTVMLFISLCLFYPGFRVIEEVFSGPAGCSV